MKHQQDASSGATGTISTTGAIGTIGTKGAMGADDLQAAANRLLSLQDDAHGHFRSKCPQGEFKTAWNCTISKKLVAENKRLTMAHTLMQRFLDFVVHHEQRKGSASTNLEERGAALSAVDGALDLARFSVADPGLSMPGSDLAAPAQSLDFQWQDAVARLELEDLQEAMESMLGLLAEDARLRLDRCEITAELSHFGCRNNRGMVQAGRQAMVRWSYMGMAVEGEEVSGFDYDDSGSFAADFREPLLRGARNFRERVLGNLRPVKCPSYRGLVVLTPRAVSSIIGAMIEFHASGRQVMDGKSRWDKAIDQQVAASCLTLTDEPHDARFLSSAAFDRDGLPTSPLPIIQQGRLVNHCHDYYSARKLGVRANGQAGGPFGYTFAAGQESLADMLRARSEILLVDSFSGEVDPLGGGNFSGVAKSSSLWVKGERQGAVVETMISGDFFEICRQLVAVSRERENPSGQALVPYLLVDGVSVVSNSKA